MPQNHKAPFSIPCLASTEMQKFCPRKNRLIRVVFKDQNAQGLIGIFVCLRKLSEASEFAKLLVCVRALHMEISDLNILQNVVWF